MKEAVSHLRGSLFLCLPLGGRYDAMMRTRFFLVWMSATLILTASGCGSADSDPGPGGVTAGDAKALDAAAKKLDERDNAADAATQK
jgi:hypothetical protein